MRVVYIPPADKEWYDYYDNQARQLGYGFVGMPFQRGAGLGSLFSGLFRAILPLASSAAKTVGRQALVSGVDLASDVLAGKTIKEAAETRGRQAGQNLLNKASVKLQAGRGLGKRPSGLISTSERPTKRRRKSKRTKRKDTFGTYYG